MVYQFPEQSLVERGLEMNRIPVQFIHVPTRENFFWVFFPELNAPFRVAFQIGGEYLAVEAGKGKHFAGHLENERDVVKRKGFFHLLF